MLNDESSYFRSHGGANKDLPSGLLDFSVNLNYYGPSSRMIRGIREEDFRDYPESTSLNLRCAIGEKYGVSSDSVFVGNGATEILWQLVRLVNKQKGVTASYMTVEPTFSEFASACYSIGTPPMRFQGHTMGQEFFDFDVFYEALKKYQPDLVYFCNPNSPTGHYVDHNELTRFMGEFSHVNFILDQAFLPLSAHHTDMLLEVPSNVLRLRSLTKDHAIAGLRLGYLLAAPEWCFQLEESRPFWSVNSLAQKAGMIALAEDEFLTHSRPLIDSDKHRMMARLRAIGMQVYSSETPFFLVKSIDSRQLKHNLLDKGILVRDCRSYALSNWIRLCARREPDVTTLVNALLEIESW